MAQATFKAVVVDTLARRIIANQDQLSRGDGEQRAQADGNLHEDWLLLRLMGIDADVERQIERIERERAKKVTP